MLLIRAWSYLRTITGYETTSYPFYRLHNDKFTLFYDLVFRELPDSKREEGNSDLLCIALANPNNDRIKMLGLAGQI